MVAVEIQPRLGKKMILGQKAVKYSVFGAKTLISRVSPINVCSRHHVSQFYIILYMNRASLGPGMGPWLIPGRESVFFRQVVKLTIFGNN